MGEDILEDALFEAVAQLAGVAFALADQHVQEAERTLLAIYGARSGNEGGGAEEQPEVMKAFFDGGGRQGEGFFQVDFVVVGGAAMSAGGIETPDFAVGDDSPVSLAGIEKTHDERAGVFVGMLDVALVVLAVKVAVPGIGKAEGKRLVLLFRRVEQVVGGVLSVCR